MRRRTTRRHGAIAAGLLAAAGSLSDGRALMAQSACPSVAQTTPSRFDPPDWTATPERYGRWSNGFERPDLGIGFLEVGYADGIEDPADWLPHVRLPLFPEAGAPSPMAWISDGYWIPVENPDERRPLTYQGMVETSYEFASFTVHAARDGWLLVHLDLGPIDERAVSWGLVWTHTCFVDNGDVPLRYREWLPFFSENGLPLGFRDGSRHALRVGPSIEHARTQWIIEDDEIEILEVDGDWAWVRVHRPGKYLMGCLGEEWEGEIFEGWTRWRSPEVGPWLWYPTRGC